MLDVRFFTFDNCNSFDLVEHIKYIENKGYKNTFDVAESDVSEVKESLEGALNDAIGLEGGYRDIEEPEEDEEASRAVLEEGGATKLPSSKGREEPEERDRDETEKGEEEDDAPSEHDEPKAKDGADSVEKDREGENTDTLHPEATRSALGDEEEVEGEDDKTALLYLDCMIDAGDDPGDAEAHEDVDAVAASHISNGVICVLLSSCRGLACESVREGGAQRYDGDGCYLVRGVFGHTFI